MANNPKKYQEQLENLDPRDFQSEKEYRDMKRAIKKRRKKAERQKAKRDIDDCL